MTRLVRSGDLGLDVVLGGGWRLVEKLPGKESTTVIIRGGPGAGKTLFSIDIALAIADALKGDVVVACVELLPSEYLAQVESARPTLVKPPSDAEPNWQPSVFLIGAEKSVAALEQSRIFCGLLDELDSETPDLTAAIESLALRAKSAGANPTVFVIDSLIANYGIGQSTPRRHVDGLMKFAASLGVGLVLCQETTDEQPSPWDFSADSVISLGQAENGERRLTVRKHRFGRSAQGAHRFSIDGKNQPQVIPRMDAWLKPGFFEMLKAFGWIRLGEVKTTKLVWPESLGWSPQLSEIAIGSALILVTGYAPTARQFASALVSNEQSGARKRSKAWVILLDSLSLKPSGWQGKNSDTFYIPIFNGPAGFVLEFVRLITKIFSVLPPRRIIIGDMSLAPNLDDRSWPGAIRTIAALFGSIGIDIPLIIFESLGETKSELSNIADTQISLSRQIRGSVITGRINNIQGRVGHFSFPPQNQDVPLFSRVPLDENRFDD